jgi:thiol-disulfide isomerase/thioredoxin
MNIPERGRTSRAGRRRFMLGLLFVVGIAGAGVLARPWLLGAPDGWSFRSILGRFGSPDDESSRLISEYWWQINYDPDSPDTGPDGDVTITTFFDYGCAACRQLAQTLEKLRATDKRVRLVFKELPMAGPVSDFAARAAMAADKQDYFVLLHRELLQGLWPPTESSVIMAAGMAGVDLEQLRRDMADPAIAKALEMNRALAQTLGIDSLPAFIIGDRIYRGAGDLEDLKAAVAQARKGPPL